MSISLDWFGGVLVWFGGILAGVLVTLALQHSIPYLLARLIGSRFRSTGVSGVWTTEYTYPWEGRTKSDDPVLTLRKFGSYLVGSGTSHKDKSEYQIRGRLSKERIITGEWAELTSDGRRYYGSFQLAVAPTDTEMRGQWIGFSRSGEVNHGEWIWKR
ncbi:MAG: hypothetical protein IIA89_15170 [Chloroflexi bacterium]|nr:hypothetical protein [Chloroflexota bacterium]